MCSLPARAPRQWQRPEFRDENEKGAPETARLMGLNEQPARVAGRSVQWQ